MTVRFGWYSNSELPSSIECLFGLVKIQLQNCKRLASLPTNICRLKYHEELDLTGWSALKYLPEILEPMEHLKYLSLERTAVKELFSSNVNLIRLRRLNVSGCKNLEFVPNSIYNLYCFRTLEIGGCLKLLVKLPPFSFELGRIFCTPAYQKFLIALA